MTPSPGLRRLGPVMLACTECAHLFRPDLLVQLSTTGCERCGGWTWIAQTDPPDFLDLPRPRGAVEERSPTSAAARGGSR